MEAAHCADLLRQAAMLIEQGDTSEAAHRVLLDAEDALRMYVEDMERR